MKTLNVILASVAIVSAPSVMARPPYLYDCSVVGSVDGIGLNMVVDFESSNLMLFEATGYFVGQSSLSEKTTSSGWKIYTALNVKIAEFGFNKSGGEFVFLPEGTYRLGLQEFSEWITLGIYEQNGNLKVEMMCF